MTDLNARCLDAFPNWIHSLADDAVALGGLLGEESIPEDAQRRIAGALNYLFKSLDLIPDGIEDLGFVDDAFVFRVAAQQCGTAGSEASKTLERLSDDAQLVQEFLGDDYRRLQAYVTGLDQVAARGRAVDEVVTNPDTRAELLRDVKGWADSYSPPSFSRDEKNLVKLRSFLTTKLPA